MAAVLGIDLGTSQVKALVMGPGGEILGRGRAGYPVEAAAEGHAETDPGEWWRATVAAVREALADTAGSGPGNERGQSAGRGGGGEPGGGSAAEAEAEAEAAAEVEAEAAAEVEAEVDVEAEAEVEVAAIGIAGQMHGVVLTGQDGNAVRPAILWLDRRAEAEAARYGELPAELTAPLGNQASAGMAGPILCWLARHEPDGVRRARWALPPKDWVRLRLTGQAATDPTDASGTLLFDLARGAWAGDLVEALGLPADKLPPILESTQIAGRLLPGPASELGLTPGIPVATGAADTAAALYAVGLDAAAAAGAADVDAADAAAGAGAGSEVGAAGPAGTGMGAGTGAGTAGRAGTKADTAGRAGGSAGARGGWALLTVGTGGQWIVPEGEFRPTPNTNLFAAVGGGFYRLAPAQNVGAALDWVRRVSGASWQELYGTAARPWRADTPVFVPYLARERWDPVAAGSWTGLTLAHDRDDLLRAALEGVAFLLRRRLEDLRAAGHHPDAVIAGGGGASEPAWRQLLADALGLPLYPADTNWLSAAGAALVAAASAGMRVRRGGRVRSGYIKAVTPRELSAASAGYARFTHKLTLP
jgi:xylulokinase